MTCVDPTWRPGFPDRADTHCGPDARDDGAEAEFLAETVDFTGSIVFLEAKVPGLVIGVVRNGETVVRGYGEISDGSSKAPNGDTLMRGIGYQGVLRRGAGEHGGRRQRKLHRPAAGPAWLGRHHSPTRRQGDQADRSCHALFGPVARGRRSFSGDSHVRPQQRGGAGGLYCTTNDILRWLSWHLDRFSTEDAEMRLLDQRHLSPPRRTQSRVRDGRGRHDGRQGLGWVVMQPESNQPLILRKSGGLQGEFSFVAFAPTHGIGVFVSMNEFSVAGSTPWRRRRSS
jgi:CubicO group peptidase (beta-lactamase class C family)